MSDVTQRRMARGTMLPAAALLALLALAPFAAAASEPVGGGTTAVTLDNGFAKALRKAGVKVLRIGPATVKGRAVTLPVSGGSLNPISGRGTVIHRGGIKLERGRRKVALANLELNTTTGSLSAKIGKGMLKVAAANGLSHSRDGFGVGLEVAKMKLTGSAARLLSKALAAPLEKGSKARPVFRANQVLGRATSATQPSTVAIAPGGNATLATSPPTVAKLAKAGVEIQSVAPAAEAVSGPAAAYGFPIGGGTISPAATAGTVQTTGGLRFVQDLEKLGVTGAGTTTMTLGNIWVDLGGRVATVEVAIENPKNAQANRGDLGRASIAKASLAGATVTADPATRTVSIQNASAALQAVTAEVLNSVFVAPLEEAGKGPQEKFAPDDSLGTFSFTARAR
jgi:hypothetical protein